MWRTEVQLTTTKKKKNSINNHRSEFLEEIDVKPLYMY